MLYVYIFVTLYLISLPLPLFLFKNSKKQKKFWLRISICLPIIGCIFFLLYGRRYSSVNKYNFKPSENFKLNLIKNNEVTIFNYGYELFEDMIENIQNAKKAILVSFYIFSDDYIGNKFLDILCLKSRLNIPIKILYDSIGSFKTGKKFFKKAINSGIKVKAFYSANIFKILSPRLNYRMHRKFVIIDEKISYIGGANIRDDHLGFKKKVSPWRDTHFKIVSENFSSAVKKMFDFDYDFDIKKQLES